MLTVHHLGISQSERIVWLCEELEIPYDLKKYDRDSVTRLAPAAYKALHPQGTAPIITDGSITLAESGAIIEYIVNKHGGGRLIPKPSDANYAEYLFWFHFANGSMIPATMMAGFAPLVGDSPIGTMLKSRAETAYAMVEKRLGQAKYFAGDELTAADIMIVFALSTMRHFSPRDHSASPNIRAYLARIAERPAYKRAMAKGDPELPPLSA